MPLIYEGILVAVHPMEKQQTKKKRGLSFSAINTLLITGVTVLVSAAFGTVLSILSINRMKAMIADKAIEIATTAASMLDGDSLKGIQAEDEDTPAYQTAYNTLKAFKSSNEGTSGELAYIYCCRSIGDGKFEFTIDPADDPAYFGESLEWTKALDSASKGKAGFDDEPYNDRWGTFHSAYAPVFDSSKEVAMIVGVDIWAKWYNSMVFSNVASIIIVSVVAAASGIAIGFLISRNMRKRFELLNNEFGQLEGEVQALISEIKKPLEPGEKQEEEKTDELNQLHDQIKATKEEIKEYLAYVKKEAFVDALTRLGNRAQYEDDVKRLDQKTPYGIVLCDLNGLKVINDRHGHEAGDKAIIQTANILKGIFPQYTPCRIGGDEFVVIIPNPSMETLEDYRKRIEQGLLSLNESKTLSFPLSISKGIALSDPENYENFTAVFNRADEMMYQNKRAFYQAHPHLSRRHGQ